MQLREINPFLVQEQELSKRWEVKYIYKLLLYNLMKMFYQQTEQYAA